MAQVVIENPILNSAYEQPKRYFQFNDEGITDQAVAGRRPSSYFVPIARPKKKGAKTLFESEWTQDRIEENKVINQIRFRVSLWRERGYPGITRTSICPTEAKVAGISFPKFLDLQIKLAIKKR